jgi:predicted transcriptional regulator
MNYHEVILNFLLYAKVFMEEFSEICHILLGIFYRIIQGLGEKERNDLISIFALILIK